MMERRGHVPYSRIWNVRLRGVPLTLKGLDVLLLIKLAVSADSQWTYKALSRELGISPSQLHSAVKRCLSARLMLQPDRPRPCRAHLKELLIHGVKYCFPVELRHLTRGIPTSYAAPPVNKITVKSGDPPPVWPYCNGEVRGIAISPIHKAVLAAALKDVKLYEMLALLDAIRCGRAREREAASRELIIRLA
jgi:hypothetical protein